MELVEGNREEIIAVFNHWAYVPVVKEIPEIEASFFSQDVRSSVLKVMADGLEDYDPVEGRKRYRHALTAKELQEGVKQELGRRVTLQNIYFHLDALSKDHDFVVEVASVKEGRHIRKYFGRTAKFFLFLSTDRDNAEESVPHMVGQVWKVLRGENSTSTITEEDVRTLVKGYWDEMRQRSKQAVTWIEQNENRLNRAEVDVKTLYLFLYEVQPTDPALQGLLRKVLLALGFPQDLPT